MTDDPRFEHEATFRRSSFPPAWRNAPLELLHDYIRALVLVQSYETYPLHLHPKFTLKKRLAYADSMPIEIIDDMPSTFAAATDEYLSGLSKKERKEHNVTGLQLLRMQLEHNQQHFNRSEWDVPQ